MKMKKLTAAIIMAGSFVATQAAAITPSSHGGSGTIHFVGDINDGACSIDATSVNQTVPLPGINASMLSSPGTVAGETPFTLKLKNCSVTVFHNATVTFMGHSGTNGAPAGTFSGENTPDSAKNVGLVIKDWTGASLAPGTKSSPWTVAAGGDELNFTVAYQAGSSVKPGKLDATVNFNIDYQ